VTQTPMVTTQTAERNWILIDAKDQVLGRLAVEVASILRGKTKPTFTPSVDMGDFVVVVNAEKVRVTGKKLTDKVYSRHTGYPGGLRQETLGQVLAKHPERAVERAVRGMLPKNKLGRQLFTKLKVYVGPTHPHEAQQPVLREVAHGQ